MKTYDKTLLPGTVLRGKKNSYRIDRVLGQGTFGITYLAYTTATVEGDLGRLKTEIQVAVKEFFMSDINGREGSTVTTGGSGGLFDKYRRKFARESVNLSNLNHRGIVNVVETFEANGTSYYAMEYCGGGSLDARIAECGGLPECEALRYFGQIASALSYMHSQRMLHLDLKPGNVMLRASGEAVLIDFGLSKQFNDEGEPESSTSIGGGTPGYASLEQANYNEDDSGSKLPVTMDVYSLGATLYKMLTGKRPPAASDVMNNGLPEQPLRDHGVSNSVIAAILRAMQPKSRDRYQTVAAFAAALDCASEATEAADRAEEPEVVLVDDGRQPVAEPQPHTPAAEPAHQEQQQNEYPEPEQPRRKWLPWVVGVAVAAIAFVVVMLLQPKPQPAIEVPEDLITAVASDTVSADEQPVQQVAQQPQKTEPQQTQQQPQRPVQQQPVEQPQPTRPESQQPVQQPQRPVRQEPVEQPQPTKPESQQPVQQPQRPVQQQPEPEPMPATVQQPQRPQHNLPEIAMVYVSGGTFTMGATSEQGGDANDLEKPAHSVTLSGYYIGKYEVTQELWKAVMGSNPSRFKGDNLPVEQVSWNDVQEFLRKLNAMTGKRYRLPTEAEWEFAARGGNSSRGYKYSGSNSLGNVAWRVSDSGGRTHVVGTKSPNELGIYDMSGNVCEWCQDWYGSYSSLSQRNPKGPNSGSHRVHRGSGWNGSVRSCRVSNRNYDTPDYRAINLGFRLAL